MVVVAVAGPASIVFTVVVQVLQGRLVCLEAGAVPLPAATTRTGTSPARRCCAPPPPPPLPVSFPRQMRTKGGVSRREVRRISGSGRWWEAARCRRRRRWMAALCRRSYAQRSDLHITAVLRSPLAAHTYPFPTPPPHTHLLRHSSSSNTRAPHQRCTRIVILRILPREEAPGRATKTP